MTRPDELSIARKVEDTLIGFGKVGLLIDDDEASVRRTARELYGGEVLPRWWLLSRSCECAAIALETVLRLLKDGSGRQPLGIMVVDRRLLGSCGEDASGEVVWDDARGPGKVHAERLATAVDEWRELEKSHPRHFCSVYQTSYPYGGSLHADGDTRSMLRWVMRSSSVVHGLRQLLEGGDSYSRDLLCYGPASAASTSGPLSSQPGYLRRRWKPVMRRLAEQLTVSDAGPTILLTGAGVSLASHAYGAGMPSTARLLTEAYRLCKRRPRDAGRDVLEPEPPLGTDTNCLCRQSSEIGQPSGKSHRVHSLDEFCRLMDEGVSVDSMEWSLETLFAGGSSPSPAVFAKGLGLAMLRFDRGLPYQHWLLAALPWDQVITTNFDTFHERSWEDHVARSPSLLEAQQKKQPRFRNTSHDPRNEIQLQWTRPIHKPYGSLHIDQPLALSHRELEKHSKSLRKNLDYWFRSKHGTLVVVGHSMRDPYLDAYFNTKKKALSEWQLCWCVPGAYNDLADKTGLMGWHGLMSDAMKQADGHGDQQLSGPLPATALEFAYDLVSECQDQGYTISGTR